MASDYDNNKLIVDFLKNCKANGLGKLRVEKYTQQITMLSQMLGIWKDKATKLYEDWRCSLIHQGFIAKPWNTLENWSEYDITFLSYPENKLRSSTEYPPESIIAVYESRIEYLEDFFKKTNTKEIEFFA